VLLVARAAVAMGAPAIASPGAERAPPAFAAAEMVIAENGNAKGRRRAAEAETGVARDVGRLQPRLDEPRVAFFRCRSD
jgi:hypothetical protein